MLTSFVLRLRSEDLAAGRVAGRIEHVASGRQQRFRDLDEVAAFCLEMGVVRPAIPEPRELAGRPDHALGHRADIEGLPESAHGRAPAEERAALGVEDTAAPASVPEPRPVGLSEGTVHHDA